MPEDFDQNSRLNRFEKKRNTTKWLTYLIVIGVILVIGLIAFFILTGGEDSPQESATEEESPSNQVDKDDQVVDEATAEEKDETDSDTGEQFDDPEEDIEETEDVELEVVESEDGNVIEAYKGNWQPITTSQEEPHEITYDQDSQDWKEMMQAAALATGLATDEMYYLWVSGNGQQQVITTFSNSNETEHYRVSIAWIEGKGWQANKVEILKENDQKYRFMDEE